MKKRNKHPTDLSNEELVSDPNSESLIQNTNYIKKLELQRNILNKLLAYELEKPLNNNRLQGETSENKQKLIKKDHEK